MVPRQARKSTKSADPGEEWINDIAKDTHLDEKKKFIAKTLGNIARQIGFQAGRPATAPGGGRGQGRGRGRGRGRARSGHSGQARGAGRRDVDSDHDADDDVHSERSGAHGESDGEADDDDASSVASWEAPLLGHSASAPGAHEGSGRPGLDGHGLGDRSGPRNFRITHGLLLRYGYTAGCAGCEAAENGWPHKKHHDGCRALFEARLASEDPALLAKRDERMSAE